jgi:hypothetical protein
MRDQAEMKVPKKKSRAIKARDSNSNKHSCHPERSEGPMHSAGATVLLAIS